ncbi:hypothetical protein RHMOL_Rhmol10G0237000 [Rhododendron molle]|uniref:Uncharacterized protein n=1 Tax=Rhododendron molle TaxID=49168 RepID=A0ACC0M5H7_RHOML|nr:hypothetical protein RHMOL_Rhmol10G0237000 [Rhododendron molle]
MALFLSLSLLSVPFAAEARIRHFKWEVKYEYKSQDCYKKLAITINGQTPGPTIKARVNDTVVVELKNSLLTENVVIHWHGIRQKGTPWFDGTAGVTQCPIVPGDTFVYKFVVDRVSLILDFGWLLCSEVSSTMLRTFEPSDCHSRSRILSQQPTAESRLLLR